MPILWNISKPVFHPKLLIHIMLKDNIQETELEN